MPTRYCLFLFLTLSLLPRPITGQEMRSFTLSFDNDGFVFWDPPSRRADYYYTHGMRLEALLARTPPWVDRAVCDAAAPGPEACVLTSLSLGHQIYTPENVFSSDPPVDDHPYGGFLYAEFAGEWIETDTRTRVGLQIGVTGTPSLGQAAHQGFHRWLDKAEPTGWEHQIPFEIAFALSAHRTGIWSPLPATWPLSVAVLPRWGGTLGTLRTSGDAGLALRAAWNAAPGADWRRPARGGVHLLAEVSASGEVVFRDLFLDGSTFGESVHAERSLWVGRRRGRAQIGVGGLALEFAATRVSPRFRAQDGPHTYGTIRVILRP
jgi:lipid A 3-O-deacylase